ncbi:MAG: DNA adenine methylase [Cyanobacteria bacterium P01_H01_bin.15]
MTVITKKQAPIRSPLMYPGGKSRLVKEILPLLPLTEIESVVSPFFGGGSLEFACGSRGLRVQGYDCFAPLANFWQQTLQDAQTVSAIANQIRQTFTKQTFYLFRTQLQNIDKLDPKLPAAMYFAVNRASFSGATLSGGCSQQAIDKRFTQSSLQRLAEFTAPCVTVEQKDFREAITGQEEFLYVDPPYFAIANLYRAQGDLSFRQHDHEILAEILNQHQGRWALSYNSCDEVRALYPQQRVINLSASKSMSNGRICPEILIVNYEPCAQKQI